MQLKCIQEAEQHFPNSILPSSQSTGGLSSPGEPCALGPGRVQTELLLTEAPWLCSRFDLGHSSLKFHTQVGCGEAGVW